MDSLPPEIVSIISDFAADMVGRMLQAAYSKLKDAVTEPEHERDRRLAYEAATRAMLTELYRRLGGNRLAFETLQPYLEEFFAIDEVSNVLVAAALGNAAKLDIAWLKIRFEEHAPPDLLHGIRLDVEPLWQTFVSELEEQLLAIAGAGSIRDEVIIARVLDVQHSQEEQAQRFSVPPSSLIPLEKRHDLRPQPFTGRDTELTWLVDHLQAGQSVTLCAIGGMGKTALAVAALWQLAPNDTPPIGFPDGILFHDFYREPRTVQFYEHAVRAYGLDLHGDLMTLARASLVNRRALIVLDGVENAEDLPAVLSVISDQSVVLITTRIRSQTRGAVFELSSLGVEHAQALLQEVGGQRAEDEEAAKRICELVGYLPLAILLAGRYLAHRGANAVEFVEMLEVDGLAALTMGQRRLESIPILLDKSAAKLSKDALDALSTAGILAFSPFTRDMIALALEIESHAATATLGELVDYGLLLRPDNSYIVSHVLVYEYAHKTLPTSTVLLWRLAGLLHSRIESHIDDFKYLADLHPHIVTLIDTLVGQELWPAVEFLAESIDAFLELQGYWSDTLIVAQAGLAAAQDRGNRTNEGKWFRRLAQTYRVLGQSEKSIEYYEHALTIAWAIVDRRHEGSCLHGLGLTYCALGRDAEAIGFFKKALAIAQEFEDPGDEAAELGGLGLAYLHLRDPDKSISYTQKALTIAHERNDIRGQADYLGNLGIAYMQLDQIDSAIDCFERALAICEAIGYRRGKASHLASLGSAFLELGQIEKSLEYSERARVILEATGERRALGGLLANLGSTYVDLDQVETGVEYFNQALSISQETGDQRLESHILDRLGNAYMTTGQVQEAIRCSRKAVAVNHEIGDLHGKGRHLYILGSTHADLGQLDKAIPWYEQARALSRDIGDQHQEELVLISLGEVYSTMGQFENTIDCYEDGLNIARASGNRDKECTFLLGLGNAYLATLRIAKAFDCYKQVLTISRESGDRRNEGAALGSLGHIYSSVGWTKEAIRRFEAALNISREVGNSSDLGAALGNLACEHAKLDQMNVAIGYFSQAIEIANQDGNREAAGHHLNNLGMAYRAHGSTEEAIDSYERALKIYREIGNQHAVAFHFGNLAMSYKDLNQIEEAIENIQQAITILEEIRDPNIEQARLLLALLLDEKR